MCVHMPVCRLLFIIYLFCFCILYSVCLVCSVLVVQWFGVGLVIERSLVRLPVGGYQVN